MHRIALRTTPARMNGFDSIKWVNNYFLWYYDIENRIRRFSANNYYDNFIEGFDVLMIEVDDAKRTEYATWTDWFYDRRPFPLLKCVYPNTKGVWPWQEEADSEFREVQPLLSSNFSF